MSHELVSLICPMNMSHISRPKTDLPKNGWNFWPYSLPNQSPPLRSRNSFSLISISFFKFDFIISIPSHFLHFLHPNPIHNHRYTILAPSAVPKGFVDAKKATEGVIDAIQLDSNDFRYGHTKARIKLSELTWWINHMN